MALDLEGSLAVIELKLDASRSLADLQAIRYAAFCSTMTMDNLIEMLAEFEAVNKEDASRKICDFLKVSDLPELNNRPRIILAAGSIDDQEMTSSVLWLNSFGIDISCVELTPYCMPNSTQVILVPRIIIPIPEAREYLVSVQKKEVSQIERDKDKIGYLKLWQAMSEEFNKLDLTFKTKSPNSISFLQIPFGNTGNHYEWEIRKKDHHLDVALHFESRNSQENSKLFEIIKTNELQIKQGIDLEFRANPTGKIWRHVEFSIPFDGNLPSLNVIPQAVSTMKTLIDRTWPLIEPYSEK